MNNSKNSLKAIKKITSVFSKNEIILWCSSAAVTLISFFIFNIPALEIILYPYFCLMLSTVLSIFSCFFHKIYPHFPKMPS